MRVVGDSTLALIPNSDLVVAAETALTAKEFAMLRLLAAHPGEPVTRDRFLDIVWGYAAFPTTRTVDNHIASLRAKLERDSAAPQHILTVHRVGYRLARKAEGLMTNDYNTPWRGRLAPIRLSSSRLRQNQPSHPRARCPRHDRPSPIFLPILSPIHQ